MNKVLNKRSKRDLGQGLVLINSMFSDMNLTLMVIWISYRNLLIPVIEKLEK